MCIIMCTILEEINKDVRNWWNKTNYGDIVDM